MGKNPRISLEATLSKPLADLLKSARKPNRHPSPLQFRLQLSRIRHAKVKDTSRERSIRATPPKHLNKMPGTSSPT